MGVIWDAVKSGVTTVVKGIGHAGYKGAEALGGATLWAGKKGFEAGKKMAPSTGKAGFTGAKTIGDMALTGLETGGKMALGAGKMLGDAMIDINPAKYEYSLFGAGLTGKGKAIVFGSALAAGSVGAYNDYETTQMGTPSGEIASPTPRVNYTRFGEEMGATGDLVFAMNRNRRG